jgi:hypothetical protein
MHRTKFGSPALSYRLLRAAGRKNLARLAPGSCCPPGEEVLPRLKGRGAATEAIPHGPGGRAPPCRYLPWCTWRSRAQLPGRMSHRWPYLQAERPSSKDVLENRSGAQAPARSPQADPSQRLSSRPTTSVGLVLANRRARRSSGMGISSRACPLLKTRTTLKRPEG